MKIRPASILSLLFILSCFSVQAQLDVTKLTQFDELKGTPIFDILPDSRGNIWIGTQSGLVRFDGYEYKRYHPDLTDSTTMGELLTYVLHEDGEGNIWIGSQEAVYRYNPDYESFTRYPFGDYIDNEGMFQAFVATITDNKHGRVYFGIASTYNTPGSHTVFYYDLKTKRMERYEPGDSLRSTFLSCIDPDDNIWLSDWTGFYKIDTLNLLHRVSMPEGAQTQIGEREYASGLAIDSQGVLWTTTSMSRLYSLNPKTDKFTNRKLDIPFEGDVFNNLTQMYFDGDQHLWIASQQGLMQFDPGTGKLEVFEPHSTERLLRDRYSDVIGDRFGNIWIGTESMGLLMYNPRNLLNSFKWDESDPSTITTGWSVRMLESRSGDVWAATRGSGVNTGINRINLEDKIVKPYIYNDIDPVIEWLNIPGEISTGTLLIESSFRKYKVLDLNSLRVRDTVIDQISGSVSLNTIYTDSRGNLWYCSYDGLFMQPQGKTAKKYFNLAQLPGSGNNSNIVTNVYESPLHGLWIITDLGLFLYDYQTGVISRHGYDPAKGDVFRSQDINSFYEEANGIAWVGTWQGGLSRYDMVSGDIKTFTTNDGLPSSSIQGILGDEKNQALWLSTFNGISRFSLSDEQFNNFSLKDGIQGLLYADGQYLKTSTGYFIFGGNNGITYFKPEDISRNSMPPVTFVTHFNIGDKSVSIGSPFSENSGNKKPIELTHSENNISIDYTGIQYDDPAKNKFAYMLENYDKSWRMVGNQRSAYYYNLPPGNYRFMVKAANSHGVWNQDPISLSFVINPPWWRTWWAYILYGVVFIAAILYFDRVRKKQLLEKERQLAKEKEFAQAKEIEKAYTELKATQKQLIHSEKMASLGELTAGIAHEIQNPLNFVNNFSEINIELATELREEIKKGDLEEADDLAKDIIQNEEKINQHGKRADAIVKSMLQHSRTSTGIKEPTDINALADEYLRLAFHGLRAKDKSFNADFKLETDPNLPEINVVAQDIGRVLLNLINNAFFAVSEKAKKNPENYKPQVIVKTELSPSADGGRGVTIRVKDNGSGIPDDVRDKIFQPFFTTKPTGQGTGLGLSLSFDIIKAHGGDLRVESHHGEGSTFIFVLPIKVS